MNAPSSDLELEALLASMSPEELAELMGMGTLDERAALLEQQMAQAQALRQPSGERHITGAGGAFGGLNDAVKNVWGAYQQKQLQDQQAALLDQKDQGRSLYLDALRRRQAAGYPSEATTDVVPVTPFAL